MASGRDTFSMIPVMADLTSFHQVLLQTWKATQP